MLPPFRRAMSPPPLLFTPCARKDAAMITPPLCAAQKATHVDIYAARAHAARADVTCSVVRVHAVVDIRQEGRQVAEAHAAYVRDSAPTTRWRGLRVGGSMPRAQQLDIYASAAAPIRRAMPRCRHYFSFACALFRRLSILLLLMLTLLLITRMIR